jgi:hypothetical protein
MIVDEQARFLKSIKTRLEGRGGREVFVINRTEWYRGNVSKSGGNVLWDGSAGCCLGLAALVEGVAPEHLFMALNPSDIGLTPKGYASAWLDGTGENNDFTDRAVDANDAVAVPDDAREAAIRDVFLKARGWNVEFEG